MAEPITALFAAGWLWETLAPTFLETFSGKAKEKWTKFKWRESEALYKQRLIETHSTTRLLGNQKSIRLDNIYTDVYVLDKLSAYRKLQVDKKTGKLKEFTGLPAEVKRKPLLDIVRDHQRVYVLGKPGAGKSTFLKSLCLECCKGNFKRTPIFISLKEWHDSSVTLEEFIEDEFKVCGFPDPKPFIEALFDSGLGILLLDGLDEIPQDHDSRQRAISSLTRLARKHTKTQIVLTCRIAATEYSFDQFSYYEIADFTPDQQTHFVGKWYEGDSTALAKFKSQWVARENSSLQELARTPLLLALLCLAFDETLSFPKRRVELYYEATNALLRKWDSTRGVRRDDLYRTLSHNRREQLLSQIAAKSFINSQLFFNKLFAIDIITAFLEKLPPRDESKNTDSIDILKAIEAQHGLLVERAVDIYSFSHLTLHEYFTARYLIEASHSQALDDAVKNHFFEDSWREVFLMIASILDDATPLFECVHNLFKSRFFENHAIISILARTSYYESSDGNQNALSFEHIIENENIDPAIYPLLRKSEDLCLTLAASFHYINCGDYARNRVREAFPRIASMTVSTKRNRSETILQLKIINEYLHACTVVIESMQVASISQRNDFVESLIFPLLNSTFSPPAKH